VLQFTDIMAKHGRSTANPHIQSKRDRIQNWLMQEGWTVGEEQAANALWCINAKTNGYTMIVAQLAQPADRINIQSSVLVALEHQNLFAAMEQNKRQDFWWNMRMKLLDMGLDFNGLAEPVQRIDIGQRIYDDGLTKDAFLQRVSQVKRGQIVVLWSIGRFLQQPTDEDMDSGLVM
jgi:hypothetical protein